LDKLTAIRIFSKVAENGGFSQAATSLGLSKSAVSKHVSMLETALGAQLFNRTTRRVRLTEEGRLYLERVSRILDDLDEADSAVASLATEPQGLLRINSALIFGNLHIAPLLPDFMRRHPCVRVELELSDRFVDLVEDGYDCAIRIGQLADSPLIARKLAEVPMHIVAAPDYLDRRGRPDSPAALADHDCLLYQTRSGGADWNLRDAAGAPAPVRVSGPFSTDNGLALRDAALGGVGIGLLPAFILGDDLTTGRLVELLPHHRPAPLPIHAVYPPNRHLSARVRRFIDFLAERFRGWQPG